MTNTTSSAADFPWLDREQYPFAPRFFSIEGARMHYIDEGHGETLLFVHGTPVWSFLYREAIQALRSSHRCVACDHLGFGLSDKLPGAAYSPGAHSARLEALVNALDLRDITLVVHDFGGPIGLSWALRNPQRVRRIVLMNTWLWATAQEPAVQKVDRLVRSPLGRFLYLQLNASPRWLLPQGFADRSRLSRHLHRQYLGPFPRKQDRYGLLGLAESLRGASDWYEAQWQQLERLSEKPWLLLWGMNDSLIRPDYLRRWEERLPRCRSVELDCGHFVAEEKGPVLVEEIKRFTAAPSEAR